MNKIFLISFLISTSVYATENTSGTESLPDCSKDDVRQRNVDYCNSTAPQRSNQNQSQPGVSSNVSRCESLLSREPVPAPTAAVPAAGAVTAAAAPQWLEIDVVNPNPATPIVANDIQASIRCRSLQRTTILSNGGSFGSTDKVVSQDGKISCQKLAGYTADFESCRSTLSMYNNVVMMEAALFVVQAVQSNQNQNAVQQQTMQRTNAGDGQNAAYDAQIATTSKASQLNQQKAMAYAAAVAALGSKIASWIKDDEDGLKNALCKSDKANVKVLGPDKIVSAAPTLPGQIQFAKPAAVPAPSSCPESVSKAYQSAQGEVIANKQAKAAFTTAAMLFAAKGIQAGIAANQLGNISKQVAAAKKQTEDQYQAPTFEYCQVNTTDPKCAGPVTQTSGSGLQDGGFSLGEGFGNNAFNPTGDADTLGGVDGTPLPGSSAVADTSSPFADDAKKASGILDPAGAASIQPGGAGAGGAGASGAGGLGGGSASLGNGTPGMDDSKKENDIKANKADGKYNMAGGGGFQAIKGMKEENPFANLFDGKGGGKLEEDRSIASGDIDGQDSGLFSKISRRYGQVQADKRIEAKNLDAE